jgi:hypothetical protein
MGNGKQIGEVEVDLAPFIGKTDGKIRLPVPKCELPNTVIEAEIKLTETTDTQGDDDSGDEENKDYATSPSTVERQTEYQNNDEELSRLRQELSELRSQVSEVV